MHNYRKQPLHTQISSYIDLVSFSDTESNPIHYMPKETAQHEYPEPIQKFQVLLSQLSFFRNPILVHRTNIVKEHVKAKPRCKSSL